MRNELCTVFFIPKKKKFMIFGPSYDVGIEYIVVGKNAQVFFCAILMRSQEISQKYMHIFKNIFLKGITPNANKQQAKSLKKVRLRDRSSEKNFFHKNLSLMYNQNHTLVILQPLLQNYCKYFSIFSPPLCDGITFMENYTTNN